MQEAKNWDHKQNTETFPDVAFKLAFNCVRMNFAVQASRHVCKIVRKTTRFGRAGQKGKFVFRMRRREQIEGLTPQETTKRAKATRFANHHAQHVVV